LVEKSTSNFNGKFADERVSHSDNGWGSVVVSYCCEKLVTEARDSSRICVSVSPVENKTERPPF
jgi:hypothetical protein